MIHSQFPMPVPHSKPKEVQRFEALDGLRGVAALMVVLLHTGVQSNIFYLPIVRHSDLFVELFFVLSGFVITFTYGLKIDGCSTLKDFFRRRFARLWPLHATMLLLFVSLDALRYAMNAAGVLRVDEKFFRAMTDPSRVGDFVAQLGLVHALSNKTSMFWNFPSWSISAEMMAYLSFGLIWAFCRGRWRDALAAVFMIVAALVVTGVVKLDFGAAFGHSIFRAICGFFVGYWTQRIWRALPIRRLRAATAVEVTTVAAVFALVYAGDQTSVRIVAPFAFGAVVLVFALGGGAVSRLLRTPFFQALGTWSYGIYMTHIFVLALLGTATRIAQRILGTPLISSSHSAVSDNDSLIDFGNPLLMDAVTILIVFLVIFVARFAHRHIEMPGQRIALAGFKSKQKPSPDQ
jgi:hypothetical protein